MLCFITENTGDIAQQNKMSIPVVVNKANSPYTVYIGRGSKWGNPFTIGTDGTRKEVIQMYREYIQQKPELMSAIDELTGQTLGCFCKPKACHGDVLVELWQQYVAVSEIDELFE
jgi:hypothetical protein